MFVCEGQMYGTPNNSFYQVISCEVLQHNSVARCAGEHDSPLFN